MKESQKFLALVLTIALAQSLIVSDHPLVGGAVYGVVAIYTIFLRKTVHN